MTFSASGIIYYSKNKNIRRIGQMKGISLQSRRNIERLSVSEKPSERFMKLRIFRKQIRRTLISYKPGLRAPCGETIIKNAPRNTIMCFRVLLYLGSCLQGEQICFALQKVNVGWIKPPDYFSLCIFNAASMKPLKSG